MTRRARLLFENRLLGQLRSMAPEDCKHVAKVNPFSFLQQVRAEVAKVVWPTRRETIITTIMTLVLVFITALFFFIIDQGLSYVTGLLFG